MDLKTPAEKRKKAVITGATGTIGMALVELLLTKYDCAVTVLVHPGSARRARLEKFMRTDLPTGKFQMLEAGLEDYDKLVIEDFGGKQDYFFHLAWAGSDTARREDAVIQSGNIGHELAAAALAARIGCEVFVGAGTQAEYGRSDRKMTSRTATRPESAYGMAKLCAGYMSRVECKRLGIRHIWMRVLSVYGPYNGEDAMLISAIRKMLQGEKVAFSKGEQIWDYLYADDAAEAFWRAAVSGRDGAVYPLGCGEERPLAEYILALQDAVAEQIAGQPDAEERQDAEGRQSAGEQETGHEPLVQIGALPYGENQIMYLCADISELTADTGFRPQISFEEGIRRTIAWCKG